MNLLLDTHTFLWFIAGDSSLSATARSAIEDANNTCYMSVTSLWEIAIKFSLGRLHLPEPPAKFVPSRLAKHSIAGLSFEHTDALAVATLPAVHEDPFDRALIAQAFERDLVIVTSDERFGEYGVRVEW